MTISDWQMFRLKGWHPFAERSAAKGWFANGSAIPFGCAEKAATHRGVNAYAINHSILDAGGDRR